jgi:hypothetical protein
MSSRSVPLLCFVLIAACGNQPSEPAASRPPAVPSPGEAAPGGGIVPAASVPRPEDRPVEAAPAGTGPTLRDRLAGVASIHVRRVDGVSPPFAFARPEAVIADAADVAALVAAIGPDRPAMDGGPRCITAFSATLQDAGGKELGTLGLYCGAGTPEPVPVIRDADASRSWSFADPAAAQALLAKVGNG